MTRRTARAQALAELPRSAGGFAFASGYPATNKRDAAVLYGILLGFVVYVGLEWARLSGLAGVWERASAGFWSAGATVVFGLTVLLLSKHNGRA